MHPAHQALKADCFARERVDHGLVVQIEFAAFDRSAQINLELVAGARLLFHHRFEQAPGIAAPGLGLIEREIRILDELLGFASVFRRKNDPDAGLDVDG